MIIPVCFVMHRFKIGGCESVFLNLAKVFHRRIYLITVSPVVDNRLLGKLPDNVVYIDHSKISILNWLNTIKFYRYGSLYTLISMLLLPIYISRIMKNGIIVNFSDTFSSLLVCYLSSIIRQFRMISWVHCRPTALLNSRVGKYYIKLLSKSYRIVCICNDQKKELITIYPFIDESIVYVIYNPIDMDFIKTMKDNKPPISTPYICMVSRLDERSKDFATPIKAFSLLPQDILANLTFVIVGDGPDRNRIQSYIDDLRMNDCIMLYGSDINPYKWMAHAKAFVFSSKSEGLGMVILEAMASGQIVISTDCPVGPKEILKSKIDCGILVDIGDVDSMKKEICRVFSQSFNRDYYLYNSKIRLEDFSLDMFLCRISQLFENL